MPASVESRFVKLQNEVLEAKKNINNSKTMQLKMVEVAEAV